MKYVLFICLSNSNFRRIQSYCTRHDAVCAGQAFVNVYNFNHPGQCADFYVEREESEE